MENEKADARRDGRTCFVKPNFQARTGTGKKQYRDSFPATSFLLPLAMLTCCETGSDVHTLIKEIAIRRVEHRSEIHSNESQHLVEGPDVACLRRRFSFCFTAGTFIPHAPSCLQATSDASGHPTAPFARSGAFVSALYRGVSQVRGTGRSERGREWSRGRGR